MPADAPTQAGIAHWRCLQADCTLDAFILAQARSDIALAHDLLLRETIAEFGELRAYARPERQELMFEAFRESDGRAWLLRVPLDAAQGLGNLLREAILLLGDERAGPGLLRQVTLGPKDALAALVLEEGTERAFALWRREQVRTGWDWTIDVLVVPIGLARGVCALMQQAIERSAAVRPA